MFHNDSVMPDLDYRQLALDRTLVRTGVPFPHVTLSMRMLLDGHLPMLIQGEIAA